MKFDELKANAEARWTGFKVKAKVKAHEAWEWACTHREEATTIVTLGVMAIGAIGKEARRIDRKMAIKHEQDLKDLYVYDRSLGIYHELRRKLRPSEVREIDARRQQGESMTSILSSMRVLK